MVEVDAINARLLALELAFKSMAQLLHEHRLVRLDTLADAMEGRAGLLRLTGAEGAATALSELVADLRETTADLPRDDA